MTAPLADPPRSRSTPALWFSSTRSPATDRTFAPSSMLYCPLTVNGSTPGVFRLASGKVIRNDRPPGSGLTTNWLAVPATTAVYEVPGLMSGVAAADDTVIRCGPGWVNTTVNDFTPASAAVNVY